MYLKETIKMDRRDFTYKAIKTGLVLGLSGLTFLLGKKVVLKRDCKSCPEYADCPGLKSCKFENE
jgi:hypothetical protein